MFLKEDTEGWLSFQQKPIQKQDSQFLEEAIIRIGNDLSLSQRTELQTLLLENKDLFGEKTGVTSL